MNKIKRIICALLSVCMISAVSITSISAEENIDSLEQRLQSLNQANADYQKILDQTEKDIKSKEKHNEALEGKIQTLSEKISLTQKKIKEIETKINGKQAEIDKAYAEIEEQMNTLRNRIRQIYMSGNTTNLEIIFGAKSFSDLIDKMELVNTLSSYDKKLIADVKQGMSKIATEKEALEADKAVVEEDKTSLEADIADLNEILNKNEELLKNLHATSTETQDAIKNASLESKDIEDKISTYYENIKKQAEAKKKAEEEAKKLAEEEKKKLQEQGQEPIVDEPDDDYNDTPSGSGYVWPTPGFYYLSSEWAEDRGYYNHGAIDIAGGGIMGSSVLAADSGTVIGTFEGCYHNYGKAVGTDYCGGSYGNYVMIDHGNGKMTIYGHLTSVLVNYGDHVSRGELIGTVGSTGNSTGPHLHFECRYNGVKYNPMVEFN